MVKKMKNIPGFYGYKVDNSGNVWSFKRHSGGQQLKLRINNNYLEVELCMHGCRHYRGVHRLVCSAFHGQPQNGQETRHLDGNTINNNPENLCWGTPQENMQDRIKLGTQVGSLNGNAKLTEENVINIRSRSQNESQVQLAKIYGLDPSTISNIVRRKIWKHIK